MMDQGLPGFPRFQVEILDSLCLLTLRWWSVVANGSWLGRTA